MENSSKTEQSNSKIKQSETNLRLLNFLSLIQKLLFLFFELFLESVFHFGEIRLIHLWFLFLTYQRFGGLLFLLLLLLFYFLLQSISQNLISLLLQLILLLLNIGAQMFKVPLRHLQRLQISLNNLSFNMPIQYLCHF